MSSTPFKITKHGIVGNLTGSVQGTASYALTASYVENGGGTSSSPFISDTGSGSAILSGSTAKASGQFAVAEGFYTLASGDYSHAEGDGTGASGSYSHAEGQYAIASGRHSHAEGTETEASGTGSHAEGTETKASGTGSHAEGRGTIASGDYSHAEGRRTEASNAYEHAQGIYNATASSQIFSIGCGHNYDRTKNAVSVLTGSGNTPSASIYMYGVGGYDGTNPEPGVNDLATVVSKPATSASYGTIKLNPDAGIILSPSGNLEVLGRLGQMTGGTGIFAPNTMKPTAVGDGTLLITEANNLTIGKKSLGVVTGANLSLKSAAAAGATQYVVKNTFTNRFLCALAALPGSRIALNEATATKTAKVVSVQGFNGEPYSSGSSTDIVITVDESVNPSASASQVRVYCGANGYSNLFIGQAVGSGENGANIIAGQQIGCKSGNANLLAGASIFNTGNGNAILGRQHISKKNRWLMAGTGHDNTNGKAEVGTALGQFSLIRSSSTFVIGNGSSETVRKNLFEIESDGKVYVQGLGSYDGTNPQPGVNDLATVVEGDAHIPGISAGSGTGSIQMGSLTTASGQYSHAEGYAVIASGNYSHAEGFQTKALGRYSHAEGDGTVASGDNSHAEGSQSLALGGYSHAEGSNTLASGSYSHAEGYLATASGIYSHAEGRKTTALGWYSHAEGYLATALGWYSHAEGWQTTASGNFSHAEGSQSLALGTGSHAEGIATTASGNFSHAEGEKTVASNNYEHAQGKFNVTASGQIFSIGCGDSEAERKNAVSVITGSGTVPSASVYIYGIGGYDGTNPQPGVNDVVTIINNLIASVSALRS